MTNDIFYATSAITARVSRMDEKVVRKPRNVLIDPKVLREALIKALRSEKKLGEWLENAIWEIVNSKI